MAKNEDRFGYEDENEEETIMSSWLIPSDVLEEDEDCDEDQQSINSKWWCRQLPPLCHKSPKAAAALQPPLPVSSLMGSKNSPKSFERSKQPMSRAVGGPGMQAIFLDSGPSSQRSCGTGVFLPRTTGTDGQIMTKKTALSPVLLPSRVVQALNINVHELGFQYKARDVMNNNPKRLHCDRTIRSKKGCEETGKICVISQSKSSSPEIFLPKEWTY